MNVQLVRPGYDRGIGFAVDVMRRIVSQRVSSSAPRTERSSRARHEEVLDAAAAVFSAKGYGAATIQDIADELGMLKGSVYYYISTKEDVLFELVRQYHDTTRAYFEEILASDDDVVAKLRRFIETETAHTAHHQVRSSLFFTEWRSLGLERRAGIVAERDRHDRFVRECIEQGQQSGHFRSGVDARIAAYGVLGMVNSVYRWYDPHGHSTAEEIGREYADLVMAGLSSASQAS